MNILDDEFKIATYISPEKNQYSIKDISKEIDEAQRWSIEAMRTIIIPTGDLESLDAKWIEFNSMPKKHRRESDWKSIELFGCTNKDTYEACRSGLLGGDIDNETEQDFDSLIQDTSIPVSESYIDTYTDDSYYSGDAINYSTDDVEKARSWSAESNRIIIIPTRTLAELESLWDSFNAMHHKHRRESDWMSLELFNVTNLKHYEYLKSQFLQKDINLSDMEKYGSVVEYTTNPNMKKYFSELCQTHNSVEFAKALLELSVPVKGVYEELITNNLISGAVDIFSDLSVNVPDAGINYEDLPFFTPDDMINMGVHSDIPSDNYYGVIADNNNVTDTITVAEWFEMYRATYDGFYTEFSQLSSEWVNKVRYLMHGLDRLKESGNTNAINSRKQSILDLGWNPEVQFTNESRIIARENMIHMMTNAITPTKMVDLCGFRNTDNENTAFNENISISEDSKLYPVYIVLTEGGSALSTAIKSMTKSIYSHASIAFDSTLSKMYSFGMINKSSKGMRGGFREENVKDIHEGGRLGVYVFFVKNNIYQKIVNMVNSFKENVKKTKYGYTNVLTYLFNIPHNKDWSLICSRFVDRCLKIAGIDITKKDSSLVSPADMDKAAKSDKKIYNIYKGLASKYDPNFIKKLLNSLMKKAQPIKESNSIYYRDERSYITGIITNIHDISKLKQMEQGINIVANPSVKRLLEDVLFDSLHVSPYCEAKEFPVQFDKDGNLLIKNLKKINYEAEYSKSHRLLKQYDKSNNLDGIKYEISKLWMMSCLIEEKLNSDKFKKLPSFAIESSSAHKARAKIINDFQYYLVKVMEKEPNFNFTEYYDNSPFSSATTKINAPTLKFMSTMIKTFMKHI